MNKTEILEKFNKLGLVPNGALEKKMTLKKINNACRHNKPRKVIAKELETGLETEYSLIYKAARALDCLTTQIYHRNEKLLSNRYKIDIVS